MSYFTGIIRKTQRHESVSRLTYKQQQKYEQNMQTGKHNGMMEQVEVNTICEFIDMLDALNRLPWREWNMLIDYYWQGWCDVPIQMLQKYGFLTEEKMQNKIRAIVQKLSRWCNGQYKNGKKPPKQRNESLAYLIEKIY